MFVKEYPLVVRLDEVEIMCLHRIKDTLDEIKHAVCDSPNSISFPSGTGTSPDGGASPPPDHVPFRRKGNLWRSLAIANQAKLGTRPVLDALFQASQKVSADTGKQPSGRPAPCRVALQTVRCCQGMRCKKLSSAQSKRHSAQIVSIGVLSKRRHKAHRRRRYLR